MNNLDSFNDDNLMRKIFDLIKDELINYSCHNRGNFLIIKYIRKNE